jgi:hypothetical protein
VQLPSQWLWAELSSSWQFWSLQQSLQWSFWFRLVILLLLSCCHCVVYSHCCHVEGGAINTTASMLTLEITSLAHPQHLMVACLACATHGRPSCTQVTRDKPLSDIKQTAARSAMQLSEIKMIQHSETATLCRCCIARCPTPEDIQDYMDTGHHEHVHMPLDLQDWSTETTGVVYFNT